MKITKELKSILYQKYGGRCAYTGTVLKDDWQVDHVEPIKRFKNGCEHPHLDVEENMVPCQKIVNHYKGSLTLDEFRNWYLKGLHRRLSKLPLNPRTRQSAKKKKYLIEVATYFGITPNRPFNGVFYFEEQT